MSKHALVKALEKNLDTILKQHPEHEDLIKVFAPILICEENLLQELAMKKPATPKKSITENEAALDLSSFPISATISSHVCQTLLKSMYQVLPKMQEEIVLVQETLTPTIARQICKAHFQENSDVLADFIDNKLIPYAKKQMKKDGATAKFKIEEITDLKERLSSVMELLVTRSCHVLAARATRSLALAKSDPIRRTCPYCGHKPNMSVVHGKAGQRDLLCTQCGRSWRYKRTACPFCGQDETKTLNMVYAENSIHERAILCQSCNEYILEVDIREKDMPIENAHALSLGIAYLDALMQEYEALPLQ